VHPRKLKTAGKRAYCTDKIDAFADDVVAALECKCASPSGAFLDAATGAGY